MRWIPVTESLPDSETTVMTFVPDSNEPVWPGYYSGEQWMDLQGYRMDVDSVTHWMDFPDFPDAESASKNTLDVIDGLFPKLKFHQEQGLAVQIPYIQGVLDRVDAAFLSKPIEQVAEALAELMFSAKTALDIIDRQFEIHPLDVIVRVQQKNRARGYEL